MSEAKGHARRVIYLARHGETDWNRAGRWQGHTDIPLTELGRQQAVELGSRLRHCGVTHVIASDLCRARDTARIAADALGISHVGEDADLRERMFGVFEGLTRAQCLTDRAAEWAIYQADPRQGPPGAETHAAVALRMQRALTRAAALPGDAPVLLISHGSAMRILGNALGDVGTDPIHNAAILRFELLGGVFERVQRLTTDGGPP